MDYPTYDLLVKDGTVIDPSQGLNAVLDIALTRGRIAAVERDIPENMATEVLDAKGRTVAPGLIDLHVHAYWGASHYGIDPDTVHVANGVTTVLDAGSSGARTFPAFRRYNIEPAKTRVFALLNISAMGMVLGYGALEDTRWADVEEVVAVGREHRDVVLGIKARVPGSDQRRYLDTVKRGIEAAERLGGFFMLHVGGSKVPLADLTALMRPGDVATHSFRGTTNHSIFDDEGRVADGVREAQNRGIVFDIGHGNGSFSFETAEKAFAQGFYPDNISSDLHIGSVRWPVIDLVTTLSKFLHLGMSLYDVIDRCTARTARTLGKGGELGTLRVGAEGDVTVLDVDEGRFELTDAHDVTVEAKRRLTNVATVVGGRLYRRWEG